MSNLFCGKKVIRETVDGELYKLLRKIQTLYSSFHKVEACFFVKSR